MTVAVAAATAAVVVLGTKDCEEGNKDEEHAGSERCCCGAWTKEADARLLRDDRTMPSVSMLMSCAPFDLVIHFRCASQLRMAGDSSCTCAPRLWMLNYEGYLHSLSHRNDG